ncbi:MAG: hypothetical protein MK110_09945 [Fuerstiella sp.]|nr:hypothetical protein [Fuerstiella sp.]
MLKNILLALVPLALMATTSVKADEDLSVDIASITDANVEIVTEDPDIDVDALSANTGKESEDAIEACFRRFGYNYRNWGHGFRYRCFNYCRPLYSYHSMCWPRPIYRCVLTPIYHHYWGCF